MSGDNTFGSERDRRAYIHCRDHLFPLMRRLKAKARGIIEAREREERKENTTTTEEEET